MKAKSKRKPPKREAEAPAPQASKPDVPPGYMALWGGTIVKEPSHMKETRKRWAKLDKPDGVKAFRAVADQEDALTRLDQLLIALFMVAESLNEERETHALCGIGHAMEDALKDAWEKRSAAWNATWGFEFGEGKAAS